MDEKTMLDSGDLLQTDAEAACQKALPAESPATQQAAGSPVEFDAAQTPQASSPDAGQLVTVADIHFRNGGKVYFFDPGELTLEAGDHVIIDTARGLEFGYCAAGNHSVLRSEIVPPLRKVVRLATANDEKTAQDNREKETHAFRVCQEKITAHKLDMQLVSAEYAFDGSKILFFFTADGRVDFRELVKDLASVFRTRIELRQIGVRDKAKMVGGLGICGRPFCCGEFLDDFQPVSIKMAKTQNLSLNPTKISGTCGRLMCCLKYEQDAYEDLLKDTPKLESLVETPDGVGVVNQVQLLREQVKVVLDQDPDTPKLYHKSDIDVIRNGKGKRPPGYEFPVQPPERPPAPRLVQEPRVTPAPVQEQERQERRENSSGHRSRRSGGRSQGQRRDRPTVQQARGTAEQKPGEKRQASRSRRNPGGQAHSTPDGKSGTGQGEHSGSSRSHRRRHHRPRGHGGQSSAPKTEK